MADNELKVIIGADNKPLQNTLAQSEQAVTSFNEVLSGIGTGIGLAIFAEASSAVTSFASGAIHEFEEAERASANLSQSLEVLGRSDVFGRLTNESAELAKQFKYLDNDDINQAFTKLIKLGGLTEDQINKLIPVIIDLNAKQRLSGEVNKNIADTAAEVVKGLEGQGRALKAYGVEVSARNTETQNLGIIMDSLGQKVKGAGEAFQNSLEGQIASTSQRVRDLQEELGGKLLPLKAGLLSFANDLATGFGALWTRLTDGTAHEALQNLRVLQDFTTQKANEKFDLIKNNDVADLTTELIKLQANVDKTRLALKHHTEDDDFRKQWLLEIAVNDQLIAKIKEQIKVKSDLRTLGDPGLDPIAKEKLDKGPTLEQLFYKIGEAQDKQWGKLTEQANKDYNKYFADMAKGLADQARIKKVIDALNHTNEAIQRGVVSINAPQRGQDNPLPLNGDAIGADQLAEIIKKYREIGAKPPDLSWLADAGAKALLLNSDFDKTFKTFTRLQDFASNTLGPAFDNLFGSIISGSQTVGQALSNFLKNLVTQLATTLATAAALAGIFALFGFGGGAGFGSLFSKFLGGGSSALGGIFAKGGLSVAGGVEFAGFGQHSVEFVLSGQNLRGALNRADTSNGRRGG